MAMLGLLVGKGRGHVLIDGAQQPQVLFDQHFPLVLVCGHAHGAAALYGDGLQLLRAHDAPHTPRPSARGSS